MLEIETPSAAGKLTCRPVADSDGRAEPDGRFTVAVVALETPPVSFGGALAREFISPVEVELGEILRHAIVLAWLPRRPSEAALAGVLDLRRRASTPLLILGCAPDGDRKDSERALAAGFDDFVAGRASLREIAGRLRALRRRSGQTPAARKMAPRFGAFTVDAARHYLTEDGRRIDATPAELEVMSVLIAAAGRACPRDEILRLARGERAGLAVGERAVDNVILRLRRKLRRPERLITVRGVGFRLGEA